jgi:hypothetical protein
MKRLSLALLVLVACGSDAAVCDGDLICPPGKICSQEHAACITSEQISACNSMDTGSICQFDAFPGVCDRGVCFADQCGNEELEPSESCEINELLDGCIGHGYHFGGRECDGCEISEARCGKFDWDRAIAGFELVSLVTFDDSQFVAADVSHIIFHDGSRTEKKRIPNLGGIWAADLNTGVGFTTENAETDLDCLGRFTNENWSDDGVCRDGPWLLDGRGTQDVFALNLGVDNALVHDSGTGWNLVEKNHELSTMWTETGHDLFASGPNGTFRYDGSSWHELRCGGSCDLACPSANLWGHGQELFALGASRILHHDIGASDCLAPLVETPTGSTQLWASSKTDIFVYGPDPTDPFFQFNGNDWFEIDRPVHAFGVAGNSRPWIRGPYEGYRSNEALWSQLKADDYVMLPEAVWADAQGPALALEPQALYRRVMGRWSEVPLNLAPGATLADVWANETREVIVGDSGSGPLFLCNDRNGAAGSCAWLVAPNTPDSLTSVWGSGDEIFATGESMSVFHLKDAQWSEDFLPGNHQCTSPPRGLWGASASAMYAICNESVFSFDGSTWNVVLRLPPEGNLFSQVWGTDATNVWVAAVGDPGGLWRLQGQKFQPVADVEGASVFAVGGTAADDVFIVDDGVTLHFDGTRWLQIDPRRGVTDIGGTNGELVFFTALVTEFQLPSWQLLRRTTW